MAEYKHGSMDITTKTATFDGFVRFMTRSVIAILGILVFLAIFAS